MKYLWCLVPLLLFSMAARAEMPHYCLQLLQQSQTTQTKEDLFKGIEGLETTIAILKGENPRLDLSPFTERLEDLTNRSLDDSQSLEVMINEVTELYRDLHQEFESNSQESEENKRVVVDSFETLILDPKLLIKNEPYFISSSGMKVIFEDSVLEQLQKRSSETQLKLLRAIVKGFVPTHSGSGIYRATDVHPDFFEVKMKPGIDRLLGCLQGGILHIKKHVLKRNEGKGGSLAAFKKLCG